MQNPVQDSIRPPINKGERVVVYGNREAYAEAYVADAVYVPNEARWAIVLEWPKAPGGLATSRVWSTDEDKTWYRYAAAN